LPILHLLSKFQNAITPQLKNCNNALFNAL